MNNIANVLSFIPLDMVSVDGYMWFSATGFNGLCRLYPENGRTEFMGFFLGEEINKTFLHSRVKNYGHKLIFTPNFSNGIDVYDIENDTFSRIPLPDNLLKMYGEGHTKTYAIEQVGHELIIFGFFYPIVIFFNLLSCQIEVIQNMYEEIYNPLNNDKIPFFTKTSCIMNNAAYILCAQSGMILNVDVMKKTYSMEKTHYQFDTICYDGECFWFSEDNDIYRMNNFQCDKIISLDKRYKFFSSQCNGDYIYYLPREYKEVFAVNRRTLEVKTLIVKCEEDIFRANDGAWGNYYNWVCAESKRVILICNRSNIICYLKDGKIEKKISLTFMQNVQELSEIAKSLLVKRGASNVMFEKNMKLWFLYLSIYNHATNEKKFDSQDIGEKIYQALKSKN